MGKLFLFILFSLSYLACGCNPVGSKMLQCNRATGACVCKENVVGLKCDMCAPQTAGVMPKCEQCHGCNDQWESIVNEFEKNITNFLILKGKLTLNVSEIQGYTLEIRDLKRKLSMLEDDLEAQTVNSTRVNELRQKVIDLMKELKQLDAEVNRLMKTVTSTIERNGKGDEILDGLEKRMQDLKTEAEIVKKNITKLIESDISGALNSSLESWRKSRKAQQIVDKSVEIVKESKQFRKKIKKEIRNGVPTFQALDSENNELIKNITERFDNLEELLQELNKVLCGGVGCGNCTHLGCDTCGVTGDGNSSCTGVKNLATTSLIKADEAKQMVMKKLGKLALLSLTKIFFVALCNI